MHVRLKASAPMDADEILGDLGLFAAPSPLQVHPTKTIDAVTITDAGLFIPVTCGECLKPRRIHVSFAELAAVASDTSPTLALGSEQAGEWEKVFDGWAPKLACGCGATLSTAIGIEDARACMRALG